MKKKTKAELQQERIEKQRIREQRAADKAVRAAQRTREAEHRAVLAEQRRREEMPANYGESIHVHKRILEGFMKQVGKKIDVSTSKVVGGAGGTYILAYTTRHGTRGTLELFDLGPMPKG